MESVKITFNSSTGETPCADGVLGEWYDGGFFLEYFYCGDCCSIAYDGKSLTQSRAGTTNLKIEVIEHKNTLCTLSECGGVGEIPVFTKSLRVWDTPAGKMIKIVYNLGGEDIRLEISAVRK